jgi:uncharacterized protein (TIRG00374 family)
MGRRQHSARRKLLRRPAGERTLSHAPHRSRKRLFLLAAMALAVHALLPQIATLEETTGALRRLQWWAVGLSVAAQAASYWGLGYTLHAVAFLTRDRLSTWGGTQIALAASSVGLLALGAVGSTAATYHWTRGRGISDEGSMLCGWLPKMLNGVVLVAFSIAGAIELLLHRRLIKSDLSALLAVSALMVGIVLALIWLSRSERRLVGLIGSVRRRWARMRHRQMDEAAFAKSIARVASTRRLFWQGEWHKPLLGAIANTGFDIATLYCLFLAARHDIGVGLLLAGYGIPLLVGRGTFLPGGVGVIETGMVGLYTTLGVPSAIAVLVVLVYRGLSFWIPTLVGFVIAAVLQRESVRATAAS